MRVFAAEAFVVQECMHRAVLDNAESMRGLCNAMHRIWQFAVKL